ncbi:MAG: thioredoxin family protein [Planctomycetaceae bacterium]
MRHHHTRAIFSIVALLATAAANTMARADDDKAPLWQPDYETARREAERLDRPLLLHFHASWCGPCRTMERDVLGTPRFRQQIESGYVAVKIDVDQQPHLMQRFRVEYLPSDVIVDHAGRILTQSSGGQPLSTYLDKLASVEARYSREKAVRIAANANQPAPNEAPRANVPPPPDPENSVPAAKRIGLDGYSPIMLSRSRKWVKGSPEFAAEHKGITYHMATAEERAEFLKSPAHYAPKLLECDPVILNEKDLAVAGSTQYGAFFDESLFLFVNADSREKFKKSPIRYTKTRHVINVNDILEGERRTAALEAPPRR